KDAWYKGTLVYMAVTADLSKTKSDHPVISRTEITLKNRNTGAIRDSIFLPPAGYEKMDIGFLLAIYKGMSASILDPNGPMGKMLQSGKMPAKMPFTETMPLMSSLEPVIDSPFTSHFKEAVRPSW
ncbi:MAG: hypothetical protein ABI210_04000, partial [Abditibacteriaceae bacterium]